MLASVTCTKDATVETEAKTASSHVSLAAAAPASPGKATPAVHGKDAGNAAETPTQAAIAAIPLARHPTTLMPLEGPFETIEDICAKFFPSENGATTTCVDMTSLEGIPPTAFFSDQILEGSIAELRPLATRGYDDRLHLHLAARMRDRRWFLATDLLDWESDAPSELPKSLEVRGISLKGHDTRFLLEATVAETAPGSRTYSRLWACGSHAGIPICSLPIETSGLSPSSPKLDATLMDDILVITGIGDADPLGVVGQQRLGFVVTAEIARTAATFTAEVAAMAKAGKWTQLREYMIATAIAGGTDDEGSEASGRAATLAWLKRHPRSLDQLAKLIEGGCGWASAESLICPRELALVEEYGNTPRVGLIYSSGAWWLEMVIADQSPGPRG